MRLGKPSRLPDKLPDDGSVDGCIRPDTPALSVSVRGRPQRGRAEFGTRRSQVQILSSPTT